jgi:HNH endonuclease
MDLKKTLIEIQDFLIPKLDTYEQAIYHLLFRMSHIEGTSEVTIGFKADKSRRRLGFGSGDATRPPAQNTIYEKLQSLQKKGAIKILDTTHVGSKIRVFTPDEIPGLTSPEAVETTPKPEDMDFFNENRELILQRKENQCFYCLRKLDNSNFVIDHVVSRSKGTDHSYRNVVASCRSCNNKKGDATAEDFLRRLYREERLGEEELDNQLNALKELKAGNLKPDT